MHPYFPANIGLGEDVLKTSWRRLQCNIFLSSKTSWRRLEDIIARRFANTSWRRLQDILGRHIANTSWRRLEDVLEDKKCYAEDVFKTSWRCLGKQEMFAGLLLKPLILQYKKKLQLKIQFIKKLHILPRVQSK